MSNVELIERLNRPFVMSMFANSGDLYKASERERHEAAAAIELADKRMAELEKYGRVQDPLADQIAELERKLAVAREALKKAEHTHECGSRRWKEGDEWLDESKCNCCIGEALAQIGGEDAGD